MAGLEIKSMCFTKHYYLSSLSDAPLEVFYLTFQYFLHINRVIITTWSPKCDLQRMHLEILTLWTV